MGSRFVLDRAGAHRPIGALALPLALGVLGCERSVTEPRPQLLIVVDTDAPLPSQALDDPAIAVDATVDTLRVDVFDADEAIVANHRDFVPTSSLDWPLSFGIPAPTSESAYGAPVLLRLRLFRAKRGHTETLGGQSVLEPLKPSVIDRLVRIDFPAAGVKTVGVTLSFDCMGRPASFADGNFTSCIDGDTLAAAPGEGIVAAPSGETRVGTTELARESPCTGAPPGKVCIPGGFAFMGDESLVGLGATSEDARPILPIRVSPFALDPTEMTVAEFRAFASEIAGEQPQVRTPTLAQCNYSIEPADREDLAINCIRAATAAEVCAVAGRRLGLEGHLPSEAQWEFAARGRGKGWRFPWGDVYPGCCVAAVDVGNCGSLGADFQDPPRSHAPSDACGGLGDFSPDGVFDLAGNLSEHVRDDFNNYGSGCWLRQGIAFDPVCVDAENFAQVMRGGNFYEDPTQLLSALRRISGGTELQVGFRCAYELAP